MLEVASNFTTNELGSLPDLAYSDSIILTTNDPTQQAWNRTLVVNEPMQVGEQVSLKERH